MQCPQEPLGSETLPEHGVEQKVCNLPAAAALPRIWGAKSPVTLGWKPKSSVLPRWSLRRIVYACHPGYEKSHTVGLKPKSLVFLSAMARALPRKVSYLLRESLKYAPD